MVAKVNALLPSHKGMISAEGATIGDRREGVYGRVVNTLLVMRD